MNESQYISSYLNCNAARGWTHGLTVGSYLHHKLKGKAKSYSGGYERALLRSLKRREAEGSVVIGPSEKNSVAYYPVASAPQGGMAENERLYRQAVKADEAWSALLKQQFGSLSGTVRYTKRGEGEPGSALRRAYDNFMTCTDAWIEYMQAHR